MTTREDYEDAARAAGIEIGWDARGAFVRIPGISGNDAVWDPRHDDGDAFRLMVKAGMNLFTKTAMAEKYGIGRTWIGDPQVSTDPCAANREAIFQAAVQIGRAMRGKE